PGDGDTEVAGEAAQPPGVLGGDHVGAGQHLAEPVGGVGGVAERRAEQDQGHWGIVPAGPTGTAARPTISGVSTDLLTQTAAEEPDAGPPAAAVPEAVRRRLTPHGDGGTRSWVLTGIVVFIAGALRLIGITHPKPPESHGKMFDEIYYAVEGHELFQHGV